MHRASYIPGITKETAACVVRVDMQYSVEERLKSCFLRLEVKRLTVTVVPEQSGGEGLPEGGALWRSRAPPPKLLGNAQADVEIDWKCLDGHEIQLEMLRLALIGFMCRSKHFQLILRSV